MRQRTVECTAGSKEAAIEEASRQLGADPDQIEVESLNSGRFRAELREADAELAVHISQDNMKAVVTDYAPARGDGRPLSEEIVRDQLREAGVQVEPDAEALAELLRKAQRGEDAAGTVIARGTPARDGKDGEFHPVAVPEESVGAVQEDGSIDFRERNIACSVSEGELLARVVPADEGTPGEDVRGNRLPARSGEPIKVRAGNNVEVSEDGTQFRAAVSGVVLLERGVLSVSERFEVRGDVDFSTGNVRMEHGSLTVRGSVRGGFTVICGGELTVHGRIEDATVEAGGDVTVRGGIVMQEDGRVQAGGDVSARFAENAVIEAGGDVRIDNDLTNCRVRAGGSIIATKGKGRIQGGSAKAVDRVEANQLGSSQHVTTRVVVGKQPEGHDKLLAEKEELTEILQKIETRLGPGEDSEILQRVPEHRRENVEEVLEARQRARDRLSEVTQALARHRQMIQRAAAGCVSVRRKAFPGTVIRMAGTLLQIDEPVSSSTFTFDPEAGSIRVDS